jgi:hypothetical protein
MEDDAAPPPGHEPASGVEDYPGVARLSGMWEADAAAAPVEQTWGSDSGAPTTVTPVTPMTPVPPVADADQQYLDFLSGSSGGHVDDPDMDQLMRAGAGEEPAGSGEVTSVLPYPIAGDDGLGMPVVDGYGAYEGYQQDGYDIVDYQQEDLTDPGEPGMPLPHRNVSDHSFPHRYAPFEIPFGQLDPTNSDVLPRSGDLTPIGEGGFQPFEKPADGGADEWVDEDGRPLDLPPVQYGDADGEPSSWFDLAGGGREHGAGEPGGAALTQRMLPIGLPGTEHPDLLGVSVFGNPDDVDYSSDEGARSLFEPVIAPETPMDDYSTPPNGTPTYDTQLFDPTRGEGTMPRPIRVRTGMDAGPATGPISGRSLLDALNGLDSNDDGGVPAGPFGPGSALPLPDGSSPSAEFRVKARTSSMVFHTESSPFYERLEPQVWFRDQKDAQRAGFTSWERPRSW